MIILGIDVPGKYVGGYAVYDADQAKILDHGVISFVNCKSERAEYQKLRKLLSKLRYRYRVDVVAIERPFLYIIAQWVGAIKCWVSLHKANDILGWYMIGSSHARKLTLGKGTASKEEVRQYAMQLIGKSDLTQHEADAIIYAKSFALEPNPTLDVVTIQGRHRNNRKYKAWRSAVIARDGRNCQKCNKKNLRGRQLQVHHIKPVDEFPHLQFTVSNGQVLCIECHVSYEQRGRQKPEGFGQKISVALRGKPKSLARQAMKAAWVRRKNNG